MSGIQALGTGTLGVGSSSESGYPPAIISASSSILFADMLIAKSAIVTDFDWDSQVIIIGSVEFDIGLYGEPNIEREPEEPPSVILFPSEDPALPPPPEFDIAYRADLVIKRVSIVMPEPVLDEKGKP